MTTKTLEGNKLIVEFMGGRWFHKRYPRNHGIGAPENDYSYDCIIEKAKYHSSWDWLFPVIQKIAKYVLYTDFGSSTKFDECLDKWIPISNGLGRAGEIDVIYSNVVQFIKWYNKQLNRL